MASDINRQRWVSVLHLKANLKDKYILCFNGCISQIKNENVIFAICKIMSNYANVLYLDIQICREGGARMHFGASAGTVHTVSVLESSLRRPKPCNRGNAQ